MTNRLKNVRLIIAFTLMLLVTEICSAEDGLIAYWSMNEGSGTTLNDTSGNNNNGTIYGAEWTNGYSNSALSFDGIND